jgi:hypothetical protein
MNSLLPFPDQLPIEAFPIRNPAYGHPPVHFADIVHPLLRGSCP